MSNKIHPGVCLGRNCPVCQAVAQPKYAKLFPGAAGTLAARSVAVKASITEPHPSFTRKCISLGKPLQPEGERTDQNGTACDCPAKVLRGCLVHGVCTVDDERPGIACCRAPCNEFVAAPEGGQAKPLTELQIDVARHIAAARQFLDNLPPYPDDRAGRGVLTCGGGPVYSPGVYLLVRMLRASGSTLPVQVWHRSESGEGVPACVRELPGVTVIDADAHPLTRDRRRRGGWELKMLAGLSSGWREWLFMDADSYPLFDPAPLFDHNKHGVVAWPDFPKAATRIKPLWFGLKKDAITGPGWNGGTLLVDLARCWRAANLAVHYDQHSEFYYGRPGNGDQDAVRGACAVAGQAFTMFRDLPRIVRMNLIQHGPDGSEFAVHRIAPKPAPGMRWNKRLPMEPAAQATLAEFRAAN